MSAAQQNRGKRGLDGGGLVEGLVGLVKSTYTAELTPEENLGLVRLERTWEQQRAPAARPAPAFWRRAPVLAAALGVAMLLPVAYLMRDHHARLTYQVANGTADLDGVIRETAPGTVVVFSEGSQIAVHAGTHARVAATSADGGRLVLQDGELGADIVHRPHAGWAVEAGPYTIRVTGTAFDVRWSAADERLDCQMKRGSVVIEGPLVLKGMALTAGMRLTVSPRTGQLVLDDGKAASTGTPSARTGEAAKAPGAEAQAPDDRPDPSDARSHRRTGAPLALSRGHGLTDARARDSERGWTRRLAVGDFESIVSEAERQGLGRVLERASRPDLAALADAARYTDHAVMSRRTLLALRARFLPSREGHDTAFFLGGLDEDEEGSKGTTGAIRWYEHYLRESPTGRFANEALGRSMMLTQKLRGAAAARPLANQYLRRFAEGPYAPAARALQQTP